MTSELDPSHRGVEAEKRPHEAAHILYCPSFPGIHEMVAYWVYSRCGLIAPNCQIFTPIDSRPQINSGKSLSLFIDPDHFSFETLLNLVGKGDEIARALIHYTQFSWGNKNPRKERLRFGHSSFLHDLLLKIQLIYFGADEPHEALREGARVLDYFAQHELFPTKTQESEIDGFKEYQDKSLNGLLKWIWGKLELEEMIVREKLASYGNEVEFKRELVVPTFKEPEGQPIEGLPMTIHLDERMIGILEGQHIRIVVGGRRGVGKSTIAASLVAEMGSVTGLLKQERSGFDKLKVSCHLVSLDRATPVSDFVLMGKGQDRDHLNSLKREWSQDLALEAVREFYMDSKIHNIVVGDLPGEITDFTKVLASNADYAIIIFHEREEATVWRDFFREMGIPVLIQLQTTSSEGKFKNAVKTYKSRQRVPPERPYLDGRLVDPDRTLKRGDVFVQTTAQVLLFDYLPWRTKESRARIERQLNKIHNDISFQLPPSRKKHERTFVR